MSNSCASFCSRVLGKRIWTWGRSGAPLGLPNFQQDVPGPVEITSSFGDNRIIQIISGSHHCVAISHSGTVYTWGQNNSGQVRQLGHGDTGERVTPDVVKSVTLWNATQGRRVVHACAGELHTIFYTNDGQLFAVGDNNNTILGIGQKSDVILHPRAILIPDFLARSLNLNTNFLSTVFRVGSSSSPPPSYTSLPPSSQNFSSNGSAPVSSLSASSDSNETSTGSATASATSTAPPSSTPLSNRKNSSPAPFNTELPPDVISVDSQGRHSLAISKEGKVFSWGNGDRGQLGHGNCDASFIPHHILSLDQIKVCQVQCGWSHSLCLSEDGRVFAFGEGSDGRLGLGNQLDFPVPFPINHFIKEKVTIRSISAGFFHSAAIDDHGRLWTWGAGSCGQLGHGTLKNQLLPKRVSTWYKIKDHSSTPSSTKNPTPSINRMLPGTTKDKPLGRKSTPNPLHISHASSTSNSLKSSTAESLTNSTSNTSELTNSNISISEGDSSKQWNQEIAAPTPSRGHSSALPTDQVISNNGDNFISNSAGNSTDKQISSVENEKSVTPSSSVEQMTISPPPTPTKIRALQNSYAPTILPSYLIQDQSVDWSPDDQVVSVDCGAFHMICCTKSGQCFSWGKGDTCALGHGSTQDYYYPTQIVAFNGIPIVGVSCGMNHSMAMTEIPPSDDPLTEINLVGMRPQFRTTISEMERPASSISLDDDGPPILDQRPISPVAASNNSNGDGNSANNNIASKRLTLNYDDAPPIAKSPPSTTPGPAEVRSLGASGTVSAFVETIYGESVSAKIRLRNAHNKQPPATITSTADAIVVSSKPVKISGARKASLTSHTFEVDDSDAIGNAFVSTLLEKHEYMNASVAVGAEAAKLRQILKKSQGGSSKKKKHNDDDEDEPDDWSRNAQEGRRATLAYERFSSSSSRTHRVKSGIGSPLQSRGGGALHHDHKGVSLADSQSSIGGVNSSNNIYSSSGNFSVNNDIPSSSPSFVPGIMDGASPLASPSSTSNGTKLLDMHSSERPGRLLDGLDDISGNSNNNNGVNTTQNKKQVTIVPQNYGPPKPAPKASQQQSIDSKSQTSPNFAFTNRNDDSPVADGSLDNYSSTVARFPADPSTLSESPPGSFENGRDTAKSTQLYGAPTIKKPKAFDTWRDGLAQKFASMFAPREDRLDPAQYQLDKAATAEDNLSGYWLNEVVPNWDTFRQSRKAKKLWRSGIPANIRGVVWNFLIDNDLDIDYTTYENVLNRSKIRYREWLNGLHDTKAKGQSLFHVIDVDVPRTHPETKLFKPGGPFHNDLVNLLHAYSCYQKDMGYVQGMSYLAAFFVAHMDPFAAFRCFANLLNSHFYYSLFTMDVPQLLRHINAYAVLFEHHMPALYVHFNTLGINPEQYLLDWFMTCFGRAFNLQTSSRIFDCLIIEGEVFLYRSALAILKMSEKILIELDFEHLLPMFRSLTRELDEESLFATIKSIDVPREVRNYIKRLHQEPLITS